MAGKIRGSRVLLPGMHWIPFVAAFFMAPLAFGESALERVRVSDDGDHFVLTDSGKRFVIWGVNYDRDTNLRLLEEYWIDEWDSVVAHFGQMRNLGANAVRVHLQVASFMDGPDEVNRESLGQLARLIDLAERKGLYLNITGLGSYHKHEVPEWYDAMKESDRWAVQVRFWEAVAATGAGRSAVFCYNLMNEPVITEGEEWLPGDGFAGKHYVQRITRDRAGRDRLEVAAAWAGTLVEAIRKHDQEALITVGVIPWAHVWPNARPGFYSDEVKDHFDFASVHFYPRSGEIDRALEALAVYEVGMPLVIEEMAPMYCTLDELAEFIERSRGIADGWFGFYWGKTIEEYRGETNDDKAALMVKWLEYFRDAAGAL